MLRSILATILVLLLTVATSQAQTEMADTMRSNGKIYVVVVVLATIFAGIFTYLVVLDRKIGRMEKENRN
ncbi:MAG: CcmD family protein [Flavipsychrobacter sp.]|nr:CcmD family protein [Flavipsychrobacter sp.]